MGGREGLGPGDLQASLSAPTPTEMLESPKPQSLQARSGGPSPPSALSRGWEVLPVPHRCSDAQDTWSPQPLEPWMATNQNVLWRGAVMAPQAQQLLQKGETHSCTFTNLVQGPPVEVGVPQVLDAVGRYWGYIRVGCYWGMSRYHGS